MQGTKVVPSKKVRWSFQIFARLRNWFLTNIPEGFIMYVVLKVQTFMARWLSWLERRPVTAEVESSSLFWVVAYLPYRFLIW